MAKKNTREASPPDCLHRIDLEGGTFKETTPKDLKHAFANLMETGSVHLCVFFHGGLVDRAQGLKTATTLMQPYADSGTYPFFFIWNSGPWDVFKEIIEGCASDPVFVAAVNQGVFTVANKMAMTVDRQYFPKKSLKPIPEGTPPMPLGELAEFAKPYDRVWSKQVGAQLSVSHQELNEFSDFLATQRASARKAKASNLNWKKTQRADLLLWKIIQRFNSHHDHGLYTTVFEETFMAAGLGKFTKKIWDQMKVDVDKAFRDDPKAGGTAFIQQLKEAWAANPKLKVTLLGHSAGGIYVQRFIEALDAALGASRQQVEVITFASAISFERTMQGLDALKRRVSALRAFALTDAAESGYWEIKGVYDKSLLYIVSSLCEGDPDEDRPLVGMRRYWSRNPPYQQPYIDPVIRFIAPIPDTTRTVWSPTGSDAKPGCRSDAKNHGDFPIEPITERSTRYALAKGFSERQ
ncbi:hypothetical protein GCM10007863_30800 [Dyella mobilis]|nr:hypothetical protein GCM10007863_30800 [Dyella mobilis]